MKKILKLPRILKINWIRGMNISVVFNNGESRIIDFGKWIDELSSHQPGLKRLLDEHEFSQVSIQNGTLSWENVDIYMIDKEGELIRVPFEIGADTLYEAGKPDKSGLSSRIGRLIREARKKAGMTQEELAQKSGTTRNYISRIENDRSGIELDTLRKIIEIGLGRTMEIAIR
jgi:DNA-binding XRE family transcriptional regulator